MHQLVLDEWSRRSSVVHARDARAKVLACAAYLVAVGTTRPLHAVAALGYAAIALGAVLLSRLPPGGVLMRAAVVLPVALLMAAAGAVGGSREAAWSLPARSYLSAVMVLVLVGATPMPALLRGLRRLGVPTFLILVLQFLYRYLLVVSEQAQHMKAAALSRGASWRSWTPRRLEFRAAAGAVTSLFARSQNRAQAIHRAMLARGFQGTMPWPAEAKFGLRDGVFVTVSLAICAGWRLAVGLWGF